MACIVPLLRLATRGSPLALAQAQVHDDRIAAVERVVPAALDRSGKTPTAALATLDNSVPHLYARLIGPDGIQRFAATRSGSARDAEHLGMDDGDESRGCACAGFFDLPTPAAASR